MSLYVVLIAPEDIIDWQRRVTWEDIEWAYQVIKEIQETKALKGDDE